MTTSPRRAVVPPRMSSSLSALVSFLLACWPAGPLACWPAGLLACFLANVSTRARQRARDWFLDAAVGEDHLADPCFDRLHCAHNLLFHPPFGELHELVGLGFGNLRDQRRLVREFLEQPGLIGEDHQRLG